jgi:hypothetical protein
MAGHLHHAVSIDDKDVVKVILAAGADPHAMDTHTKGTPTQNAENIGHQERLTCLGTGKQLEHTILVQPLHIAEEGRQRC